MGYRGILFLACLFAGSVSAATINVPADQATIQAAINAANDGDTVLVAPGTYNELINFNGKAITVKSSGGAASTILDGKGSGPLVTFNHSEGNGSVLQGFTLANAYVDYLGAAVQTLESTSPSILDNIFLNDQAKSGYWGGAIGGSDSSPVILRNYFSGNPCGSKLYDSVIGFVGVSSPVIADNVFVNNPCQAVVLEIQTGSAAKVYNNTMVGNRTALMLSVIGSAPGAFFSNNIIAFNDWGLDAIRYNGNPLPTWTHNLVYDNPFLDYGAEGNQTGQNGNISSDPMLKDWAKGDVHLVYSSPAIDAGDSNVTQASATDFYGDPRTVAGKPVDGAVVDIGADESVTPDNSAPAPMLINVPADQPTIQAAINAAPIAYSVIVAPGTYYEQLDFLGKLITVSSSGGPAVTILDGNGAGPIVNFHSAEYKTSVLRGFTLRNAVQSFQVGDGPAVNIHGASPTIEDDIFVNNVDDSGRGGAIAVYDGAPNILRNYFTGNSGGSITGGTYCAVGVVADAVPVVADNVFANNSIIAYYQQVPSAIPFTTEVYNNTFVGNKEGLYLPIDIYSAHAAMLISNNIIAFNQIGVDTSPLFPYSKTPSQISHNIVFNNTVVNYQGVADQTGTNGNISSDPKLKDWVNGDAHLLYGSPAIDVGDSTVSQASSTDFYRNARVFAGNPGDSAIVDIGAVEYEPPVVTAAAGSLQVIPNIAKTGTLGSSGADSTEPLTFVLVTQPAHGSVKLTDAATGTFQYVPVRGYVGPDSFTFHVTDPYGSVSDSATEQVMVTDIAPTASDSGVSTTPDTAVNGAVSVQAGYAGQVLQFRLMSPPAHGSVSLSANGQFHYNPATGYAGQDSFTFQAKDPLGATSNLGTETVTVKDVAPLASASHLSAPANSQSSGTLRAVKSYAGQALSYQVVGAAAHGGVTITDASTGAYTYTPSAGFKGSDAFTFQVTDQWGTASKAATVSIRVL